MRGAGLALLLALAGCEAGEPQADGEARHGHVAGPAASPGAGEFDAAMARMHRTMGKAGGDVDESFMRMMIPHHQGAVEMARIQLRHGTDPEARRLAQRVIVEQSREIAEMQAWLAKRGAR
jgi:uncharacterized protein (DUF305 family)